MKIKTLILIIITFYVLSCSKEEHKVIKLEDLFKHEISFSKIEHYYQDYIIIDFQVEKADSGIIDSIHWTNPPKNKGFKNIRMEIYDDINLSYTLFSDQDSFNFNYEILADTIFGNQNYDFRNKYIGEYKFVTYERAYHVEYYTKYDTIIHIDSIKLLGDYQLYIPYTSSEPYRYSRSRYDSIYFLPHNEFWLINKLNPLIEPSGTFKSQDICYRMCNTGYFINNDTLILECYEGGRGAGFQHHVTGIKTK